MPSLTLSPPLAFGIIASAGIFLFFIGLNQARRAAGGSEDFQNRLAAYGVTTAGAAQMPQTAGFPDTLNHLFQPAADRLGRGQVTKGKPSIAEQAQRADLNLRTAADLLIQMGSTALV